MLCSRCVAFEHDMLWRFQAVDQNGNGEISLVELLVLMRKLGAQCPEVLTLSKCPILCGWFHYLADDGSQVSRKSLLVMVILVQILCAKRLVVLLLLNSDFLSVFCTDPDCGVYLSACVRECKFIFACVFARGLTKRVLGLKKRQRQNLCGQKTTKHSSRSFDVLVFLIAEKD